MRRFGTICNEFWPMDIGFLFIDNFWVQLSLKIHNPWIKSLKAGGNLNQNQISMQD
jgi:hypothetical protein